MKYNRRLVSRDNLTDLEAAVIALEEDGWEIDPTVPEEHSGTLLGALRSIRKPGMRYGLLVPMRRGFSDG